MRKLFRRDPEPPKVYAELVAAKFTMLVPAAIMSVIFVCIATYTAVQIGSTIAWIATATGTAASAARIAVILAFRRAAPSAEPERLRPWEKRLARATVIFAASLGALGACSFLSSSEVAQMLATGLLFGYCSGAVARGYVRPRICFAYLLTATLPVATAAAVHGGTGHWMMSVMFLAFLIGSLETVRHGYFLTCEQIGLREEMATVARHDPLTKLANRFGLRVAYADLLRSQANLPMLAVHCLDLDRFKPVNDCFGHPAGDALLRQLAERIRATLRPGDLAARLGGDEFVVVQTGITHADEAEMFARRLSRALTAPFEVRGHTIEIGVSLGYATSPPELSSLDELIAAADTILYRVKHNGGGVGSSASLPKAVAPSRVVAG